MLCWKSQSSSGHLKCKGGEARDILPFVVKLAAELPCKQLHRACQKLRCAYSLMRNSDRAIDSSKLHRLLKACGVAARMAKVKFIPKFHYLSHFGEVSQLAGNPRHSSCMADESYHSDMVRCAQACHIPDFAARLLTRSVLRVRLAKGLARLS